MKSILLLTCAILLLFSCGRNSNPESIYVKDIDELNNAISQITPASEIVLANGIWKDVQVQLFGIGTKKAPITLRAETPGEVFIEGQSFLHLGGQHLIVEGLYFRNGYSPRNSVIGFKIGEDSTAFNSRVTNCVIEDFSKPSRLTNDRWIELGVFQSFALRSYLLKKRTSYDTRTILKTGFDQVA